MRKLLVSLLCATALVASAADRRAPGFDLMDHRGGWHDLNDYRGKPVLLAFIETTCPQCATFSEKLEEAKQKFGDKIGILAVVVAPKDNVAKIAPFVAGHKLTYPVVFDMGQMTFSYVMSPTLAFPTLFLIDANGNIQSQQTYGPLNKDLFTGSGLTDAITRLMNVKK